MTNAGFEIFASYSNGTDGVVLGEQQTKYGMQYVTWVWDPKENYFCWGHYYNNKQQAVVDYMERLRHLEGIDTNPDREREIRIRESIFDMTDVYHELLDAGDIEVEDSRELVHSMNCWAEEYEETHDPDDGLYLEHIWNFTYAKLMNNYAKEPIDAVHSTD